VSVRSARPLTPLSEAIRACRGHLGFAALFSAALNVLYLAPTLYMLQVYDRVVPTRGRLTLVFLTLALLLALGALSALDFMRGRLLVRMGLRLERELAGAVLDASLARPAGARDVLVNRAMREFDVMRQAFTGAGILALFDAPWSPIYLVVSYCIHPALGALTLVGAAILAGLAVLNEVAAHGALRRANEAASASYLSQQHSAVSADVIRALGMRRAMVTRHLQERGAAADLQLSASFSLSAYSAVSRFVRLALQSMALGLGAYLAINQQISAGGIFAASLLTGRALAPLDQLLGGWRSINQAHDAYRNLKELLPDQVVTARPTRLPAPSGAFRVEQLGVMNAGRGDMILRDVSFAVASGEIVGVIGPSGAGKSTLMRVIAGAAAPDRGVIRFDDADIQQWDREELARHIGYMPQDATLFAGTLKENIARFRTSLGEDPGELDAQVIEAAQLAGAHQLILSLPAGYDTVLGLGGRGLSPGHAQRIALARALFGRPALVILDEPNAHLDPEGEAMLAAGLMQLKRAGATVVVVAHRNGGLSAIEKFLYLRDGTVEMFGPREEVSRRLSGAGRQGAAVRTALAGE
jgi:ATP-binding cassette subfamily C protein